MTIGNNPIRPKQQRRIPLRLVRWGKGKRHWCAQHAIVYKCDCVGCILPYLTSCQEHEGSHHVRCVREVSSWSD